METQPQSKQNAFSRLKEKLGRKNNDFRDVLESRFIKDGVAEISYIANSHDDIVEKRSPKERMTLNPDLVSYAERYIQIIPSRYPLHLSICGVEFNEKEKEEISAALLTESLRTAADQRKSRRDLITRAIIFVILTTITLCLITTNFEDFHIAETGIEILLEISMEELFVLLVFQLRQYFIDKKKMDQITHTSVTYTADIPDTA